LRIDIRQVFDFIRCSSDPEKLKQLMETDASYQNMEEDAENYLVKYWKNQEEKEHQEE